MKEGWYCRTKVKAGRQAAQKTAAQRHENQSEPAQSAAAGSEDAPDRGPMSPDERKRHEESKARAHAEHRASESRVLNNQTVFFCDRPKLMEKSVSAKFRSGRLLQG